LHHMTCKLFALLLLALYSSLLHDMTSKLASRSAMTNTTKVAVSLLCIMLSLSGLAAPAASAAARLNTANKNVLISCLQQEYLMRDTYQSVLTSHPELTAFATVSVDEVTMIATLERTFAKYGMPVPADSQIAAANALTAAAISISTADGVALGLEQSTADLMTQLFQTADNRDVLNVVDLIKKASLGSHMSAFTAEQKAVVTPLPATLSVARPFLAPVTLRTVAVPANIDRSGATDVSSALNAFIASVPDGSIIAFPTDATYRLDTGIQFANRHGLVFAGNGTTLMVGASASGNDPLASSFVLGWAYGAHFWEFGNTDIAIRDFVLVGNSPSPGVFLRDNGQHLSSFEVEGATRVEITGCRSSNYYGDFVKVGVNSTSVWVHDNTITSVGRNGGTIISGRDITFERNSFGTVGYCVFDVEPNKVTQATYNAKFLANTVVSWGNGFLAVEASHTGAIIDGIVVDGNTVTGSTIETVIDNGGATRIKNISFTNNTGAKATTGPILIFAHIDGLTIEGNVQPLKSGPLAKIVNSTGR